jgi:toxin ParE1/3/4
MSSYRLSRRARARLTDIIAYTNEKFGRDQAEHYRDEVLVRLKALAEGKPPYGRPCSVLIGDAATKGLLYAKSGGHFIIFTRTDDGIIVVDFVHERRDLPKLIEGLKAGEG